MKFQIHPVTFGVSEQYHSDSQIRNEMDKKVIQSRRKNGRIILATFVFFLNFLFWYYIINL